MNHQGTTVEKEIVVRDDKKHEIVRRHSEAYEPSDTENSLARLERFQSIGNWTIGAIATLLGARFLLNLLAANQAAGISQLVNLLTTPLVLPFTALFGMPSVGASVFDTAALTALIVYTVVGHGLLKLMRTLLAPNDPSGEAYSAG